MATFGAKQKLSPVGKRKSKGYRVLGNLLPFLLAAATFALVEYGAGHPGFVEKYYTTGIYPYLAGILSVMSGLLPFSAWDIFWTLVVLGILASLWLVLTKRIRPLVYLLRMAQFAAILYAWFYFSWGFNYFRQPIETRLHWTRHIEKKDMFPAVLDTLISAANASRVEISLADNPAIDSLVEDSYHTNAALFGYSYPNGSRRPKTMVYTSFFAKSQVSGYFGPFFNEVHLNGVLLPTEYPFVLAHEKAHQFGISGEAEANFIGWYICQSSPDKRLRYSGNIQLLQYFLADPFHHEAIREYLKRFDKRAMADIMAQRNHWKALRNETLDKVQTSANNAYLKTNKIHEGVMNYNSVVRLAIEWYLNNLPPDHPAFAK